MSRGKFALGNDRYVQVLEWRGEVKVDFREWESKNDLLIPTKKGIRLGLMQYKNLLTGMENFVGPALSENKDDKFHVGANVFLSVKKITHVWICDSIRNLPIPTKKDPQRPVHASLGIRGSGTGECRSVLLDGRPPEPAGNA